MTTTTTTTSTPVELGNDQPTQAIEDAATEAFAERLLDGLNDAALMLMVSIGHRARLFDAMAELPPSTSAELAAAAGKSERYVREWLGAMVTGGIVAYDPQSSRYELPAAHAGCLTRAASPNNFAVFAQYIGLLGSVEDDVLEAFEHGRGVPYERYGRFHQVMAEDSGQTVVAALEQHILSLDPTLRPRLQSGIDVLDVGCGSGRALCKLARLFPNSRFRGYDLSVEAIDAARRQAAAEGFDNIYFEVRDCTSLGDQARYDLVLTFDAVHDQPQPDQLLVAIRRALKPDGLYLMQDIKGSSRVENNIGHAMGTLLYTISCMHCMSVSLAQGGAGLGAMWGRETALRMLTDAGFDQVVVRELSHDPQNDYYLCRFSAA